MSFFSTTKSDQHISFSDEPDGLGYYYANAPNGDQLNVRLDDDGLWYAWVGGDLVPGSWNKRDRAQLEAVKYLTMKIVRER